MQIPVVELAQDDGSGQSTPPSQGDTVTIEVEGTVQSVDGDTASIKITKVNGQDVPDAEDQADGGADEMSEDDLRGAAASADNSPAQEDY